MTATRTPLVLTLAAGLLLGSGATWLLTRAPKPTSSAAPALKYHCPMHPEVVRDAPGQCPICGMELVAFNPSALASPSGERKIAFYRNPMDPSVHSPVPMDDPMGMAYVPVYEDELGGAAPVPGLADITIDPAYQRLIGVRTVEVATGPVGGSWSTPPPSRQMRAASSRSPPRPAASWTGSSWISWASPCGRANPSSRCTAQSCIAPSRTSPSR